MVKGRATSVKPIEPTRRRKETIPRSEAWLARVADGKQARVATATRGPGGVRADGTPRRSGGAAGAAGAVARARAGADPLRTDGGLAVRLLPRRGRWSWRPTWRRRRTRGSRCSCAGTPTCPTSGCTPPRSGTWSSTSTTSTRRSPARSSGTSSGWPPASRSPRGASGFRRRSAGDRARRGARPTGSACGSSPTRPNLAVWYAHLDADDGADAARGQRHRRERTRKAEAWPRRQTGTACRRSRKLTQLVDGQPRIVADPPLIVPIEELFPARTATRYRRRWRAARAPTGGPCARTAGTCSTSSGSSHMARKVVGVGSVGTRAWILLFEGLDGGDPLFLQAKEAQPSVLEQYAGRQRVRPTRGSASSPGSG